MTPPDGERGGALCNSYLRYSTCPLLPNLLPQHYFVPGEEPDPEDDDKFLEALARDSGATRRPTREEAARTRDARMLRRGGGGADPVLEPEEEEEDEEEEEEEEQYEAAAAAAGGAAGGSGSRPRRSPAPASGGATRGRAASRGAAVPLKEEEQGEEEEEEEEEEGPAEGGRSARRGAGRASSTAVARAAAQRSTREARKANPPNYVPPNALWPKNLRLFFSPVGPHFFPAAAACLSLPLFVPPSLLPSPQHAPLALGPIPPCRSSTPSTGARL